MELAIALEGIAYRYPGSQAGLGPIDLAVVEGELLALVGPSGSGKTTLLKLLVGFFAPDSGTIRLYGKDVVGLVPQRRDLGVLFQNYALFPHMSVLNNVSYPLKLRGMRRGERLRRALGMLTRVGLDGLEHQSPSQLSGGQQQRVALARALVFKPRALVLDEPLSALDPELKAEMRDLIRRVQRETSISTILITHDQETALVMADRVAVLRHGRIEQCATPVSLYDRPCNAFVARFVGRANLLPVTVCADAMVDSPFGPLRHQPDPAFPPGSRALALIRPGAIKPVISPDQSLDPGATRLAGFVGSDHFFGTTRCFDFHVHGTKGGILTVETHTRARPGAVIVPPEAISLLPLEP